MVVYSITSRETFNDLERQRTQIFRVKDEDDVPVILVGSQCHLEDERVVGRDEGQFVARQWGCPFMEVSAETNTNITEAFIELGQGTCKVW